MPKYLCNVRFGLVIEADSEDEAMDKASEFERMGWTAIVDDIEVWESELVAQMTYPADLQAVQDHGPKVLEAVSESLEKRKEGGE